MDYAKDYANYNQVSHICQVADKHFVGIFANALPAGIKNNKLPDANNRGFIFIGSLKNGKMEQKAIWTQKALRNNTCEQYVTAAAFYRLIRDGQLKIYVG